MPHLVVIGGGARSGKSRYAEERAALHEGERRFLATAVAFDDEMRALVTRTHVRCVSALPAEEVASWTGVAEAARDEALFDRLGLRPV